MLLISALEEFLSKFPQHKKSKELEKNLELLRKDNSEGNLEVGVLLPLTGKLAAKGQKVLQGIQLAYSLLLINII